ncbi:hypothetical protein [Desulfopila sp. IMCC35008]|uniref:hypothetical protein n=1 Tax=Desulfopila sp. IMCC35008 TaxID=2653858 RepID=UPI0013D3ED58|nr:hypothetical protein [Desulfopila sp. IMCC35008]
MSDRQDLQIVLAGGGARFQEFEAALKKKNAVLHRDESGEAVLQRVSTDSIQIVAVDQQLADMGGLDLVVRIAQQYPFVNTALVSTSSENDFHEKTEGLGVLMQLPSPPDGESAEKLIAHYHVIWG